MILSGTEPALQLPGRMAKVTRKPRDAREPLIETARAYGLIDGGKHTTAFHQGSAYVKAPR